MSKGMTKGLVLDHVALSLAGRVLIGPLDLSIAPGEVVTLMGPSGSGKSSLLALLCGTLDPAFRCQGQVRLDGDDITHWAPERRRLGILFQDDLLFPHLSVGGNLAFGLPAGLSREQRRQRVEAALDETGLGGFASRDPATLSGGQRARVSLLRMLLSQPHALLLDEPFGRLDSRLRDQFREFVFTRARTNDLPVLMVTHDMADAEAARGKIVTVGEELTFKSVE
jgi:putative thiamine transport system ATP-binding protein